jgi:3-polyprenyl-4-hydroxybenzoate decarboxylase
MTIKIDRNSIPRSYRDYLKKMVEMGEFFEIDDEVDWNLEMGAICIPASARPRPVHPRPSSTR